MYSSKTTEFFQGDLPMVYQMFMGIDRFAVAYDHFVADLISDWSTLLNWGIGQDSWLKMTISRSSMTLIKFHD